MENNPEVYLLKVFVCLFLYLKIEPSYYFVESVEKE